MIYSLFFLRRTDKRNCQRSTISFNVGTFFCTSIGKANWEKRHGGHLVPTGRGFGTYCSSFNLFPTHLVSLRGNVRWLARSPNSSICDFFLWDYLKEKIFKNRLHTLEELEEQFWEEIGAIPVEICQNTAENFRNRLHKCIADSDHRLSDVNFKT